VEIVILDSSVLSHPVLSNAAKFGGLDPTLFRIPPPLPAKLIIKCPADPDLTADGDKIGGL